MVDVTAEMVANVVALAVRPGDEVSAGATLVVVESMKMEIPILAPVDGRVVDLRVVPGEVVAEGDVLATIDPR